MKQIKLTQNKICLVDDEDFEWISSHSWQYRSRYASRIIYLKKVDGKRKNTTITLHRLILEKHNLNPRNKEIDHINGNPLDNRKENLRIVTHLQNSYNQKIASNNTSGYKGVSYSKEKNKWTTQIRFNKKLHYLGDYSSLEKAARVYNEAARKYHGEFARLNEISGS